MGNLAIGYFNRLRAGVVTPTGGSWRAALPASNMLTPERAAVARSTTAATTDTKVSFPLGAAYSLRLLGLDAVNFTSAAQVRWSIGTSAFDTSIYAGSWTNWLQATNVETAITEHGGSLGADFPSFEVLGSTVTGCTYVSLEIDDNANPAGYVDVGFAFAGQALVPEINPEYGSWGDGQDDLSTKTRGYAGQLWTDPNRRMRRVELSLSALTEAEAITLHEIQRVLGTVGPLAFVPDIADAAKSQRYGFFGTLRTLGVLENPEYARRGNAFAMEQG